MFAWAQGTVLLVLGAAAFVLELIALVDCLRHQNGAFVAAGKRSKGFWLTLTVASAAVGFLTLPAPLGAGGSGPLGLLGFVAVIVAAVYMVDVRPAVRSTRRPPRRESRGGW